MAALSDFGLGRRSSRDLAGGSGDDERSGLVRGPEHTPSTRARPMRHRTGGCAGGGGGAPGGPGGPGGGGPGSSQMEPGSGGGVSVPQSPSCGPLPPPGGGSCGGSPAYPANGELAFGATDLRVPTAGFPLVVSRTYNSGSVIDGPNGTPGGL